MRASRRSQGIRPSIRFRKISRASCDHVQGLQGQLPKALHVVIPRKRRGARQRARTGCTMPHSNQANRLCTWFRFDRDAAGARFDAQSLQEQGQEGSVAVSAPIEAKDELAETGWRRLARSPWQTPRTQLLRLENTVWIQARISWASLSPTTWGRWRSRGAARAAASPAVCLDDRGRGGVARSEAAKTLGAAGRDRGQPQAARRVAAGWPRRSRPDRTAGCARGWPWRGEAWRQASRRCGRTQSQAASATARRRCRCNGWPSDRRPGTRSRATAWFQCRRVPAATEA